MIPFWFNKKQQHDDQSDEERVVIEFFETQYTLNPTISIDWAILKFEKASTYNLREFAEQKNRTVDSYYATYLNLFEIAQHNVRQNQQKIEKKLRKRNKWWWII